MKNKFTLLILDDKEINIYSLRLLIEDQFDVNIETALNAKDAMSIVFVKEIDLILCDIQMPEIDGFQFAKYLKKSDNNQNIPIIFITGIYDTDVYMKEAYSIGGIDYITKPIDDILLSSKLKVYIELFNKRKEDVLSLKNANDLLFHNSKMSSLGEIVGIISHQLKQPLNVLSLYCEDIKFSHEYNELDVAHINDFSKQTKRQIHYMNETINGFLDFYNTNKPKKEFYIKELLSNTYELIKYDVQKNNIELKILIRNNFKLLGIKMELSQVFINLITNSIQAFKEDEVDKKYIKIEVFTKEDSNYILVSDNAGGINETNLKNIFEPTYTTKESGTGIGLYLVSKIIKESFNGNLELENYENGIRFIFQFKKG